LLCARLVGRDLCSGGEPENSFGMTQFVRAEVTESVISPNSRVFSIHGLLKTRELEGYSNYRGAF
jgi:hypothetical protein